MLIFSLLLPSYPIVGGPRGEASWRELAEPGEGPLSSSPGPQGSGGIRGWGQCPQKDLPSPAGPMPGAQAEKPSRLPPSLSGNGEKTGSGKLSPPAGWWEGEGAALQFPPDQQSLVRGEDGDRGLVGSPIPTHIPDGVSELTALHAAATCPYRRRVGVNARHLDSSPLGHRDLRGSGQRTPPSRSFPPWETSPHLHRILDQPARGPGASKDKSKVDAIGFGKSYRILGLPVPTPSICFPIPALLSSPFVPLLPHLPCPLMGGWGGDTAYAGHGKLQAHRRLLQA